jgi:hypothetical protein
LRSNYWISGIFHAADFTQRRKEKNPGAQRGTQNIFLAANAAEQKRGGLLIEVVDIS